MNIIPQYFGAFYACDNGELWGAKRLHYVQCAPNVCYVRMAKEEIEQDVRAEFVCDMTPYAADSQPGALLFVATGDISSFHPITQAIIQHDLSTGISREDIVTLRAGIMATEFLGFCPEHVFVMRPELRGSEEFRADVWWEIDNPECV